MKRSSICCAILAALSALQSFQLCAEQPQTSSTKEETEVVTVYGHKMTFNNRDIVGSISSINQEAIERAQEAELTNILKKIPGVSMTGSVAPLSSLPSIRGLDGERIHISVDNVKRKVETDGGSNIAAINSLGIDPTQIKQIQVLRGADSLTVGSGAIGGSLRLVTKDAADYLTEGENFGSRLQVLHQSVSDSNQYTVSVFGITDDTDTVLHVNKVSFSDVDVVGAPDVDETPDVAKLNKIKNDSERVNLSLKNTWYLSDTDVLKSKIDWSETESLDQPFRQRQSYASRFPMLSEDYRNDFVELSSTYSYMPASPFIDLDIQLTYSDKDYEKETKGYYTSRGNQIDMSNSNEGSNTIKSLRVANLSEFDMPVEHKLAVEFSYLSEEFEQSAIAKGESSTFYGLSKANNLSLSIIDHISLMQDKLLIIAGLRYDSYERSSNVFLDYDKNDNGELSNELGLTFRATENINFYLKYAEAFRAPSVQELYKKDEWRCHIGGKICYQEPQPDLKPETSENIESGIGYFIDDIAWADKFSVKAMYFDNDITNFIRNVPFMYYIDENGNKQQGSPGPNPSNGVPVATHRDYSAKNIGRLQSRGVEVELNYTYGAFDAYVGYSEMKMDATGVPNFFLGKVEQEKQPYVDAPADKTTVNLNYQVIDSINAGVQYINYSKQKRLPKNYLKYGYGTDAADVFNLNVRYINNNGLAVRVGVDNVTGERYVRAPASEANDPAELGRNYKVTISYQF